MLAGIALASILALVTMFLLSGAFVQHLQVRQQEFADRAAHAQRVKSGLLQLNATGMDYVTHRNPEEKVEYAQQRDALKRDFETLDRHTTAKEVETYSRQAGSYFLWLEQAFKTRETLGLTHETGLEGSLRKAVHAIEARLFELNDTELAVKMLMMRRHEKDFMMRLDAKYLAEHRQRAEEFKSILSGRAYSVELKQSLLGLLETYQNDFRSWSEARLKFEVEFAKATNSFHELTGTLSNYANHALLAHEAFTQRQKGTLEWMAWMTWLLTVLFASGCLVVTWRIGQSIAAPLHRVARDMLSLCENRVGHPGQFRHSSRNEIEHLRNVLDVFRECLEETDRLHEEVRYHRDNLSTEVVKQTHELREQTLRLEQALVQEKELNDLTNQFVSTVSHEFRTPLTIIDAAARRVAKRADTMQSDDIVERMDVIRGSVKRLSGMVEQTLDASKLASGQMEMTAETVDIASLVKEIIDRHKEIAPNFDFVLKKKDVPGDISADARLLDHIFANLISNAIKYSADRPRVEVMVEGKNEEGRELVEVRVRDYGVGIPKHELPKIAERFFRASTSKGIKGTGIGLNLVTSLVELHSGRFLIDSEEGEWTEVTIQLPVEQPEESEEVCAPKSNAA